MQLVTILVQSVIILVLGAGAFFGWRFAWKQFNRAEDQHRMHTEFLRKWENSCVQNAQLEDINEELRAKVAAIPLAPKPKPVNDGVIRARSAAQVRQVTEQRWGTKPGDEDAVN